LYHLALENPDNRKKVDSVLEEMFYPFYRFFSNYGTGIGETMEEVVGVKFIDFIPKFLPAFHKKTGKPIKPTNNGIYKDYNKKFDSFKYL
jgi:hypothetical protein